MLRTGRAEAPSKTGRPPKSNKTGKAPEQGVAKPSSLCTMPRWICSSPVNARRAVLRYLPSTRRCRHVTAAQLPLLSHASLIVAPRSSIYRTLRERQRCGSLLSTKRTSWRGWRSSMRARREPCERPPCARCRFPTLRPGDLYGRAVGGSASSPACSSRISAATGRATHHETPSRRPSSGADGQSTRNTAPSDMPVTHKVHWALDEFSHI